MRLTVELGVAEIQSDINGDRNEIKAVEKETEVEKETVASHRYLNDLSCNSECVSYQEKDLKKQTFSLCGTGNN